MKVKVMPWHEEGVGIVQTVKHGRDISECKIARRGVFNFVLGLAELGIPIDALQLGIVIMLGNAICYLFDHSFCLFPLKSEVLGGRVKRRATRARDYSCTAPEMTLSTP